MNFRQLETLVSVAELRNFTRAAKALCVTQPAVSFQIRSLEEELGAQLLERQGKRVSLTAAGEIVYREAQGILAALDRVSGALASLSSLDAGEIVIGASSIPGEFVLPKLAGQFKARYPGIRVVVRVGDTAQVVEWLLNKGVDLGVVGARLRHEHLRYTSILSDELVAVFPAGAKLEATSGEVGLEELLRWSFVRREEGSGTWATLEERLTRAGLDPSRLRVTAEFSTTGAVLAAVAAGVGISVVSRWAAEEAARTGGVRLLPVQGMDSRRDLFVVENTLRHQSRAAAAFVGFLTDLGATGGKEA